MRLPSTWTSKPGGRNVLKPTMSAGLPRKSRDTRRMTPGVSILIEKNIRLRLEVLHNVEKVAVDLRRSGELDLHLVQIRKCVFHFQSLKGQRRMVLTVERTRKYLLCGVVRETRCSSRRRRHRAEIKGSCHSPTRSTLESLDHRNTTYAGSRPAEAAAAASALGIRPGGRPGIPRDDPFCSISRDSNEKLLTCRDQRRNEGTKKREHTNKFKANLRDETQCVAVLATRQFWDFFFPLQF
jgi:hypothetical protein